MNLSRIIAIVLIVLGTTGLIYRQFSYTKETHEGQFGALQFSVKEKESVEIPVWLSAALIAVGAGLLVLGRKPA
ncbi:hypothetical protein SAMN04488038_11482 [Solimonas aquatica]|uniref:Uncharacterized protein n=1 Tax=Solimonas aquatica TaxID=489703 RepID=A0A1H9KXQ0_9GAMM|nr:hypothetical protein [Solimonas aquatica]SER03769.1 hypothetical protein SAMN04488038_11482 [Solimonas aquatica]